MTNEQLRSTTLKWLEILNHKFGNLSKEQLIKSGGHDNYKKKDRKIPDNIKNKITRDTLNYATTEGTMR